MYVAGTILTLKNQRPPVVDKEKKTSTDFPYNRVEVVGQSPINDAARGGSWTGADGEGVIVKPLASFGSTIDEPFGKLRTLYDVESIPETIIEAPQIRVINAHTSQAGQTPEEVFAEKAAGTPPLPGETRGRLVSPLADVQPEGVSGPLGSVEPEPVVTQPAAPISPLDVVPEPVEVEAPKPRRRRTGGDPS